MYKETNISHSMNAILGQYSTIVNQALTEIDEERVVARIWAEDPTVWRPDPTEITNRLGWLHSPTVMPQAIERISGLVDSVRADGYTHVLLLGMGGSSLAPEVFQRVYGQAAGPENAFLELAILDSTDPDMLLERAGEFDLNKTLFVVATKSGGTVETLSGFKYFYNQVLAVLGENATYTEAGKHFIAITDPGSKLVDIADTYKFRDTFLNDPNIGGRYAALSYFGMVPAGLVGVDLGQLLARAQGMVTNARLMDNSADNVGVHLGVMMGELAKQGRDKVTLVASQEIGCFVDWVEQLIAESTGKEGKGVLPVVGESLGHPDVYGDDRFFVHLRLNGDTSQDAALASLADAGHPVVTFALDDRYDLGAHFFLWEMATVIAGHRMDIQPFDQPDVEAAKILARDMVAEYMEKGTLPEGETAALTGDMLNGFVAQAHSGDYIAIHAYVHPTPETDAALNGLRLALRDRLKLATTVGYGPRFLHSTGQLHKGDGGDGLFIQFTADADQDVDIPDEVDASDSTMSFGLLKNAQALGDAQALLNVNRRLIRCHLGSNVADGLNQLTAML